MVVILVSPLRSLYVVDYETLIIISLTVSYSYIFFFETFPEMILQAKRGSQITIHDAHTAMLEMRKVTHYNTF
jgi:hypothetical protein